MTTKTDMSGIRVTILEALILPALWAVPGPLCAASPATFTPVTYMGRYDQPRGLIEGSPGLL